MTIENKCLKITLSTISLAIILTFLIWEYKTLNVNFKELTQDETIVFIQIAIKSMVDVYQAIFIFSDIVCLLQNLEITIDKIVDINIVMFGICIWGIIMNYSNMDINDNFSRMLYANSCLSISSSSLCVFCLLIYFCASNNDEFNLIKVKFNRDISVSVEM